MFMISFNVSASLRDDYILYILDTDTDEIDLNKYQDEASLMPY